MTTLYTECCHVLISSYWRFCPKCGQEARVQPSEEAPGTPVASAGVDSGGPTPEPTTADGYVFASGAVRSEIKPFYSAIPATSLRRLSMRATGAPKGQTATMEVLDHNFSYGGGSRGYGYGNWMLGLEMEDTFNHIIDHLFHWKDCIEGGHLPVDDELAAAAWGIMMPLMTFEQRYVAGGLRKDPRPETGK